MSSSVSVIRKVKETVGLADSPTEYRCADCGEEFERRSESDSPWFSCPSCDSRNVEPAE